jgi:hypothetical protein
MSGRMGSGEKRRGGKNVLGTPTPEEETILDKLADETGRITEERVL